MLKDYGMKTENAVESPLPKTANLLPTQEDEKILNHCRHKKYRSMIGSLLYLAVCRSLDVSFSVAVLARQFHAPTSRHLDLIKQIMRYVAGKVHFGLSYQSSFLLLPQSLRASADAD